MTLNYADNDARDRRAAADKDLEVLPPGEPMPNVRRFLADQLHHPEHVLLVHQGGQFYQWDGTCWPAIEDAILRSRLYRWFERRWYLDDSTKKPSRKPFAPTMRKTADLMDALRAVTIVETTTPTPSWFKRADIPANETLACENGLIHWPTRKLYPHTPRFYIHHSVPFAFNPAAPPPRQWLAFLRELWGDDHESIACLQEMFGYLISGDTAQQKMFMLVGPKRGGKGTIGRVLTRLLGRHNVAGPTLSSLGTNFGLQDLIAKPVAIISDARLGAKSDHSLIAERLLSISGEDLQNVDRKYLPPWSGQLPTRFVVLTNELPRLADSSGALASRFIVLLLQQSFYNKENPQLTEELCEELPGVFLWALDGLQRLRARGHFHPAATSRDAIQALEDLASPVGAFLRDRCTAGAVLVVEVGELYRAYQAWCEEHGQHRVNQQVFGRDVRAARPEVRLRQLGADRRRHYIGLGLGHSRESRVTEHCSADVVNGSDAAAPQWTITRESREQPAIHVPPGLCDHCGQPATPTNPLIPYDWPGRPGGVWLHRRCEAPWHDAGTDRGVYVG
jgi:putative DNA primase/helicase